MSDPLKTEVTKHADLCARLRGTDPQDYDDYVLRYRAAAAITQLETERDKWMADYSELSQDDGKKDREIERLRSAMAWESVDAVIADNERFMSFVKDQDATIEEKCDEVVALRTRCEALEALVMDAFPIMSTHAARHWRKADAYPKWRDYHAGIASRDDYWLDRAGPIYNAAIAARKALRRVRSNPSALCMNPPNIMRPTAPDHAPLTACPCAKLGKVSPISSALLDSLA